MIDRIMGFVFGMMLGYAIAISIDADPLVSFLFRISLSGFGWMLGWILNILSVKEKE